MIRVPLLVLAVAAFGSSAFGLVVQIPGPGQDIPKSGTGVNGGNGASAADNFARLQTVLSTLTGYPTPIATGSVDLNSNVVTDNQLLGFEYAVLHYGVGNDGARSTGGGVAIYYLTGGTANFTFPANGLGPNGVGAFAGGTLFNSDATPGNTPSVPDSGNTLALTGMSVVLFAGLRRLFS